MDKQLHVIEATKDVVHIMLNRYNYRVVCIIQLDNLLHNEMEYLCYKCHELDGFQQNNGYDNIMFNVVYFTIN